MTTHPLSEWHTLAAAGGSVREVLLAAADPSHVGGHASAALRNALLLAAVRWGARSLRVVALRSRRGAPDVAASQLLDVTLPAIPDGAPLAIHSSCGLGIIVGSLNPKQYALRPVYPIPYIAPPVVPPCSTQLTP